LRATWSAPGGNTYQGRSNALQVQINNTIKRALKEQSDALLNDHQQEDLINGGDASTTQFHYLLVPNTTAMGASTAAAGAFDANTGAAGSLTPAATAFGTAQYVFKTRRDFRNAGRGY
jgi:hypothetical protein